MKYVSSSLQSIVHLADVSGQPLCGQTNRDQAPNWQLDIGPATCQRCRTLQYILDEKHLADATVADVVIATPA